MPNYIRNQIEGASYFFTLTIADRHSTLLKDHIQQLRQAYQRANTLYPFNTIAICILPDHLHAIWQMPEDNGDYALRWRIIKSQFSRQFSASDSRSTSKIKHREKGIWQRRYWEHQIRDDIDMQRHIDYIHHNPVKHGLVAKAIDWPHSTFHRYVKQGIYPQDWGIDSQVTGQFGE